MIAVVIQARMGSSRLPGKVLMDIEGKPLLKRLMERLLPSQKVDQFIIATTENKEDDAIESFCETEGYACHRGSDWDVLERFWSTVESLDQQPHTVVRICADNPLHNHKVLDEVLEYFGRCGSTYFSNSNHDPSFLEDGFDTEVFSYDALRIAQEKAELLSEREHVCPYIKAHFSCGWKKVHPEYQLKLSVDTENDLKAIRAIFRELGDKDLFSIYEVVELLEEKPEIRELNAESIVNAGFAKTLNEDRKVK